MAASPTPTDLKIPRPQGSAMPFRTLSAMRLALWPNAKAPWEHPAPSTAAPGSECSVIHSTGPEALPPFPL
ncbi:hypothetical protein AK812_SmicGene14718 [Symbiodinium microadriaticum]|uniref:Uncharacterized protein n=1 Tax=Symbiodinium microadriaticum TaxID=2951 RepID=A0A1Q9E4T5_SYMMI|nr:hypothetical protein AK812_SmicGene14718 [Symbiodinium microadriaticum]